MTKHAEFIANELGFGSEIRHKDGFLTYCPCHSIFSRSLYIRQTSNGLLRYECRLGCKRVDIRKELEKRNLLEGTRINEKIKAELSIPNKPIVSQSDMVARLEEIACTSTVFFSESLPEPRVYVHPFLRERSLTMIYAEPGIGKSWLVHMLALMLTSHHSQDYPIGDWRSETQCGVLLIDGELPETDLQSRLKSLAKKIGAKSDEHPLTIITAEAYEKKYNSTINIGDEKCRMAIAEYMKMHPENKLLILDNISSLTQGVSENAKGAWDPINQWLISLRRQGIAVILVHHASKSGTQRGTSGRTDNLDNVIELKRANDDVGKVEFAVKFVKGRNLKPGDDYEIVLSLEGNEIDGLYLEQVPEPEKKA